MSNSIQHPRDTRSGCRYLRVVFLVALTCGMIAEPACGQVAGGEDDRATDRAAIRAAMDSFVKAFEACDAQRLASHWTAEGEFENAAGLYVNGREKLEAGFISFFRRTPEVTAKLQPESLRFLSHDAAIDEGMVTVQRGPTMPAETALYSALLVRDGETWLVARLSESSASDEPDMQDLAWLVGEWKSLDDEGAEIRTAYAWNASKTFLHVQFSLEERSLVAGGSQMIGFDPETGGIRSWTFEDRGGVAEADWRRDGEHWVLEAVGTFPDGRTLVETNILRRVGDDLFTWQSIDRTLDDEQLPDLAPVKVMRVVPARADNREAATK